ncbi:unnamed protein product [Cylicocyclus nassatus]|uniref:Uncharacterized protein n=1 Tax=Cylicocyclus nassatus TaxID=53992 RepID=A0AA36GUY9_CYLNA|nr:unnamed protein product [Cylicocyclus nassatus]
MFPHKIFYVPVISKNESNLHNVSTTHNQTSLRPILPRPAPTQLLIQSREPLYEQKVMPANHLLMQPSGSQSLLVETKVPVLLSQAPHSDRLLAQNSESSTRSTSRSSPTNFTFASPVPAELSFKAVSKPTAESSPHCDNFPSQSTAPPSSLPCSSFSSQSIAPSSSLPCSNFSSPFTASSSPPCNSFFSQSTDPSSPPCREFSGRKTYLGERQEPLIAIHLHFTKIRRFSRFSNAFIVVKKAVTFKYM